MPFKSAPKDVVVPEMVTLSPASRPCPTDLNLRIAFPFSSLVGLSEARHSQGSSCSVPPFTVKGFDPSVPLATVYGSVPRAPL